MSEGQVLSLMLLFFVGVAFLIPGIINVSDDNPKLGYPLIVVGVLHVLPALMAMWIKAVSG